MCCGAPAALDERGDEQEHGDCHAGYDPEGSALPGLPIGIGVHRENSPHES
jgi:hypothetical protein